MDGIFLLVGVLLLLGKKLRILTPEQAASKPIKILGILYLLPFFQGFIVSYLKAASIITEPSWDVPLTAALMDLAMFATLYLVFFYKTSPLPSADTTTMPAPPTPPSAISLPLPKAGQILKEAVETYKQHFWVLVALNLLIAVAPVLYANLTIGWGKFFQVFFYIFILLMVYWSIAAQLLVIKNQGSNFGFSAAIENSRLIIWPLFATFIICAFAVLGGLFLLIVPGIIFMTWFSLYPFTVVDENLKYIDALKRSEYYVKGRVGQTLVKLLYIIFLGIVIQIALGIILVTLQRMSGLTVDTFHRYTFWLNNLLTLFLAPLLLIYQFELYKHLKFTRP